MNEDKRSRIRRKGFFDIPSVTTGRRGHLFFWLVVTGCCISIIWLGQMPALDVFRSEEAPRRAVLIELPARDVLEAKLFHAQNADPYEIGLFGNSRVLMISADHFKDEGFSFFNFGIGGISFLTSVNVIEWLSAHGKLPKSILVSFDHPEIPEEYSAPLDITFADRASLSLSYAHFILKNDPRDFDSAFAFVTRFVENEWQVLKQTFGFERLRRVVAIRWPGLAYALHLQTGIYRLDGSRTGNKGTPLPFRWQLQRKEAPAKTAGAAVQLALLKLANLRRQGHRIIIYESPIHPDWQKYAGSHPTDSAQQLGQTWRQACQRLVLICLDSPTLQDTFGKLHWEDGSHPPSSLLADWLKHQLATAG